jgi:RND family efflux transporter MFP subunit
MHRFFFPYLLLIILAAPALAEPPLVSFTVARSHELHRVVHLDGIVESTQVAVMASEVAGLVDALLAPEGTVVKKGQPLIRLRREPIKLLLQGALGELAESAARLKSAELRLERTQELVASKVVSRQIADDATYEAEAQRGRVEQLKATVARLERDLANTTVRAAFSGVVGAEHIQVGEWLQVGAPVAELISLESLEVRLEVPEQYFSDLRTGIQVDVGFQALRNLKLRGTVRAIVPRADPRSRTFPVLVQLDNRGHRLGVGMLARVDLLLGQGSTVVLVPKDAVTSKDAQDVVYVLDNEDTAHLVQVRVGAGLATWFAVDGAVEAGDRVVVRGNERLEDGQEVRGELREVSPPVAGKP